MKQVALVHPLAKMPVKASDGSSGWDIHTVEAHVLQPQTRKLFHTGLKIAYDPSLVMRIDPRSKLANKYGIAILAGIGDSDYRGEYGVILYNSGTEPLEVKVGDPIAQLVFYKADQSKFTQVPEDALSSTERGEKGIHDAETRLL